MMHFGEHERVREGERGRDERKLPAVKPLVSKLYIMYPISKQLAQSGRLEHFVESN